jgi:tetratricopeptide (TPR) repeat protein
MTANLDQVLGRHARVLLLLRLSWLWLCPLAATAQSPGTVFEAANRLYEEGKFAEAAAAYQKLAQTRETSAALYFNLGNALFKSGQIGRAVAAYRAAEQLTPRDPDVRANLQFARNQTSGPTLAPKPWQRWFPRLTLNEWTLLAATPFWALLLLLAAGQWQPTLRANSRGLAIVLASATVLSGAGLGVAWYKARSAHTVIVVTRDAVVRHGPLDESQMAFTVHDGAELSVLDQKDDWLKVTTDPARIGWVRRDQVLVAPSGGSLPSAKAL